MTDNKGSGYRTLGAVTAGGMLIALALAAILYGTETVGVAGALGVFLLIAGIILAVASIKYSGAADKFGPSEADFRLVGGVLLAAVGAIIVIVDYGAAWYVAAAVLLIVVAVLGIAMALKNNKGE